MYIKKKTKVCLLLELELKKKEKSRKENMTTSSNKEVQQINAHFFSSKFSSFDTHVAVKV